MRERELSEAVGRLAGSGVVRLRALGGGASGGVSEAELADGRVVVVKAAAGAELEGWMLGLLRERGGLPTPGVIGTEEGLLVMEKVEGSSGVRGEAAERHAAECLARLHEAKAPGGDAAFGLDRDTVIGGLHQPNGWMRRWVEFYRERRLRYMSREARQHGRIDGRLMERVERAAARLEEWIGEPAGGVGRLIHGDVWSGNVLSAGGIVRGFIDPAACYAEPEMELAFIAMFGTFGRAFFERYGELRPEFEKCKQGFWEVRKDVYQLYPLLVHVRLFGGAYVGQLDAVLRRLAV